VQSGCRFSLGRRADLVSRKLVSRKLVSRKLVSRKLVSRKLVSRKCALWQKRWRKVSGFPPSPAEDQGGKLIVW